MSTEEHVRGLFPNKVSGTYGMAYEKDNHTTVVNSKIKENNVY